MEKKMCQNNCNATATHVFRRYEWVDTNSEIPVTLNLVDQFLCDECFDIYDQKLKNDLKWD
jgi:hypothetical protein